MTIDEHLQIQRVEGNSSDCPSDGGKRTGGPYFQKSQALL